MNNHANHSTNSTFLHNNFLRNLGRRGEGKQDPATTKKRYIAELFRLLDQAQGNIKVVRAISALIDRKSRGES